MKDLVITGLLIFLVSHSNYGQNINFFARLNIGYGTESHQLSGSGGTMYYSGGGGLGIEAGVEKEIVKDFVLYLSVGDQIYFSLLHTNVNGNASNTSYNFNRVFFNFGASKVFWLKEKGVRAIIVGAGANYNIPGKLKLKRDDVHLGTTSYESNIGFHIDFKIRVRVGNSLFIDPGIRYKSLFLDSKSYEPGSESQMPDHHEQLNASGLEFSAALIVPLNKKNR